DADVLTEVVLVRCRGATPHRAMRVEVRSLDRVGTLGVRGGLCQHGGRGKPGLHRWWPHGHCCAIAATVEGAFAFGRPSPSSPFLTGSGTVRRVVGTATCARRVVPFDLQVQP